MHHFLIRWHVLVYVKVSVCVWSSVLVFYKMLTKLIKWIIVDTFSDMWDDIWRQVFMSKYLFVQLSTLWLLLSRSVVFLWLSIGLEQCRHQGINFKINVYKFVFLLNLGNKASQIKSSAIQNRIPTKSDDD